MKITVFTGNQPRHLALIRRLSKVATDLVAIVEVSSLEPWSRTPNSAILRSYFEQVLNAERKVFGILNPLSSNVCCLPVKAGELAILSLESLDSALTSDLVVVFGSSYIKSPLIDLLIERRAINLHLGVSPYYRGTACNFWALADGRPDLVGGTVHMLSSGIDSGKILFHALPEAADYDGFTLGMLAVDATHQGLIASITDGSLLSMQPLIQDRGLQMRYSRGAEFTEAVAASYLANLPSAHRIGNSLRERNLDLFVRPFIGSNPTR